MKKTNETMSYEEFKGAVAGGIKQYLPDGYSGCSVKVDTVGKTNEVKESLSVIPTDAYMVVSPNIYLDDAYR